MSMSKQDFELVAETIRESYLVIADIHILVLGVDLAEAFADAYPKFKKDVFFKAVGLDDELLAEIEEYKKVGT